MRHSAETENIPYHSWNSVFAMSFGALSYIMPWSQHMCFENRGFISHTHVLVLHANTVTGVNNYWKSSFGSYTAQFHGKYDHLWPRWRHLFPRTQVTNHTNNQASNQPGSSNRAMKVPHIHLRPPKHAKATRCNTVAIYGGHWGDQTHCLLGTYYMGWHERALAAWLDRTWTPGHSAICRCGFLWASRGNYPGHLRAFIP